MGRETSGRDEGYGCDGDEVGSNGDWRMRNGSRQRSVEGVGDWVVEVALWLLVAMLRGETQRRLRATRAWSELSGALPGQ